MATHLTAKELRNMQMEELRKEAAAKRMHISKMHLEVQLRSEKDTARFRREKKEFARLLTVIAEKEKAEGKDLKKSEKASTVSAPTSAKATVGKKPAKKTGGRSVSSSKK